jgi:hypothetical protein
MSFVKTETERRHPVICDVCGSKMVFADEVFKSVDGRNMYIKYVCPHRMGEQGCGKTKAVIFGKDPNVRLKKNLNNHFVEV